MNILILSASTGGGHAKAAETTKKYLLSHNPNLNVKVVDTLSYISPLLNKTISGGYLHIARQTPALFGLMYKSTNTSTSAKNAVSFINNVLSHKLITLFNTFKPDIIIATHMFPSEMTSKLKEKLKLNIPLMCIVTDYAPHKTWISKNVNAYIVASHEMKEKMIELGVPQEKIYPFGIPVESSFFNRNNDKFDTLKKLGLNPSIKTFLIMAGSFGVPNVFNIYSKLCRVNKEFQIIILTGKNKKLYKAFKNKLNPNSPFDNFSKIDNVIKNVEKIKKEIAKKFKLQAKTKKETRLIYFSDEVYKYMHACDFIITKPGGLTVSEALASGLPMVLFDAIPGQEQENADFLVRNKMAVDIGKGDKTTEIIEHILENDSIFETFSANCSKFYANKPFDNILNLIKELAKS